MLHKRLGEHPISANRVAQLVNAVLNRGVKKRKVRGEFKNIIDRIDLNKENSRDAWIRPSELPGLVKGTLVLAAPKSRFSESWAPAIWFTLLCGTRLKSETLRLRWRDVHFGVGEFTFRETKNGSDHSLPMTGTLRAILTAQPQGGPDSYVFGTEGGVAPHRDSRKAFASLRSTHSFTDDITPHALRHTASSYIRSYLHLPDGVNDAILNHSRGAITDTYAHSNVETLLQALEQLDEFVREAAGPCPWLSEGIPSE